MLFPNCLKSVIKKNILKVARGKKIPHVQSNKDSGTTPLEY